MKLQNKRDAAKGGAVRRGGRNHLLRSLGALLLALSLLAAIPMGAVASDDAGTGEPTVTETSAGPTETSTDPTETSTDPADDPAGPADDPDGTENDAAPAENDTETGGAEQGEPQQDGSEKDGSEKGDSEQSEDDGTIPTTGGTDVAVISGTEPIGVMPGELADLLSGVTIVTENGEAIEGGKLYVGEKYKITLTFAEGGAQSTKQFAWTEDGTMTFQLPANFKVDPKAKVPLTIQVNGEDVTIGEYSVDENGKLVVTLNEEGKKALGDIFNAALDFEMDAAVQAGDGSDSGHIDFGDAGEDFGFEVVDQARVEVDKQGKYTEDEGKQGGKLEYTVTTTVKRGSVYGLAILDEFTPPNTSALDVKDVNPDAIKVTLKKLQADGTVTDIELKKGTDYELVEVPDAEHPGKKTFQVKLKEGSTYATLNEGDVLEVTYPYEVEYVKGSTDVFWGNVANDVHVTGKGKVPAPVDDPSKVMPEIDIDERRGSNVEIQVVPPGDGIIFKTQEFSEADHKLHYTLYTTVPAGTWKPFFIQDDMVVEFGGQRYNLQEFKENGRVSNLKVSAVDVETGGLGNWSDSTDEQRRQSLEELKAKALELTGYDMYHVWNESPTGYDPASVGNCIRLWDNNNLDIIFGEWIYGERGLYGNWDYDKDRLIITEYDLDMSDDPELGLLTLVDTSNYSTNIEKSASEVLLAGITNTVHMRFDGYNPGYSVFFNNADRMNKTGVPDKSDNSITWTVTMNTTDTTVNQYFQEVTANWMAQNAADKHNWDTPAAYTDSMQAVFYDVLPEGWEYVEGSLTATARNKWGSEASYPYDTNGQLKGSHELVTQNENKQVISAPLMFFYDNANTDRNNLFNWFGDELVSLTFTYKLKATDQWIRAHAADTNAVTVHNYADIRDNLHPQAHWTAETNVPYIPQHLSKTAEQVGDSNLLQFTLHVNPGNVHLDSEKGYLVVTDTSTNLEIQKDTIKVTDAAGQALIQVPYAEDMTLEDGQWALMPETESGQFKLMVPDGKALLVTYNALIPELGEGIPVSNKAAIEGIVNADTGFDRTINVNSINAGGSGNTYTLDFQKVDSTNEKKALPGAEFKFYIVRNEKAGEDELKETEKIPVLGTEYSCYSEETWEFTTDANGRYHIPSGWKLESGNYYILVETKAPAGYLKLDPVLFYYGAENQADTVKYPNAETALPGGTLTVKDPPIQALRLIKVGSVGGENTSLLAGAEFTITPETPEGSEPLYRGVSDGEGVVQWTTGVEGANPSDSVKLANGKYTLEETVAPDGFNKLTGVIGITVDGGKVNLPSPLPDDLKAEETENGAVLELTIPNPSGFELPESGGAGTGRVYILGGLFLTSAALALVCANRRKKARG